MNRKFETDLDALKAIGYKVLVNNEEYDGKVAIGDTLDIQGIIYYVVGINEDSVMIKELEV
jgi:hypothetical protein